MIKAFYSNLPVDDSADLFKPVSSEIKWTQSETSQNVVNLQWFTLLNHSPGSSIVMADNTTQYWVFMTTDMDANLDSECILNKEVQEANKYNKYKTFDSQKDVAVRPGQQYKVNIVADIYDGEFHGNHYIYESFAFKA